MSLMTYFFERESSFFFKSSSFLVLSFSFRSFLINLMTLFAEAWLCLISLSSFVSSSSTSLLTFESSYECLHLLIKHKISKNRSMDHDNKNYSFHVVQFLLLRRRLQHDYFLLVRRRQSHVPHLQHGLIIGLGA
jgi:hypothetical protein